ncbi:MAG: hypothetical protein ACNA78_08640, partial [Balneolaceae bacterium]
VTTEVSEGDANFTNYVAIGNSLTAGFMDAALYNLGQQNSLAALINEQFVAVGGTTTFNQPDINSANGFNTSLANPDPQTGAVLGRFKLDTNIPGPSPVIGGDPIQPFTGFTSSLNNFGVPGVQVGQLLTPDTGTPGTAAFNPFYARFASSPGSSTILSDALSAQPSFFSLWIGSNDILGYALSGATNDAIFTSEANFQQFFGATVNALMDNTTAKGVVADIPPVLAIPFFRAVPFNAIGFDDEDPVDQATVNQLNAAFGGFNAVLDGIVQFPGHPQDDADRRKVQYQFGANPIFITDPNLEDVENKMRQLALLDDNLSQEDVDQFVALGWTQARPMEPSELVLLSAANVLGTQADPQNPLSVRGVVVPLQPQFHLTNENILDIETRRAGFNQIIENTVSTFNAAATETRMGLYRTNVPPSAFLDLFGALDGQLGVVVNGVRLQPDFSPNGVFSTDGVHPNARGNAILANEFIRVIESTFNAQLPRVDVLNLPSVQLCAGDCVSQLGGS